MQCAVGFLVEKLLTYVHKLLADTVLVDAVFELDDNLSYAHRLYTSH